MVERCIGFDQATMIGQIYSCVWLLQICMASMVNICRTV